jgi:hypothetical protein
VLGLFKTVARLAGLFRGLGSVSALGSAFGLAFGFDLGDALDLP